MTVTQVGRTANSVTINVSGIDYGTGSRQTEIYIPKEKEWYSLSDAKASGFIDDYEVSALDSANGDITVYFFQEDIETNKVWKFEIAHIKASGGYAFAYLNAVLGFYYEGTPVKYSGNMIDITVDDMKSINLFSAYMGGWIGETDALYYPLEDVEKGDIIAAEYVYQPAENILSAAENAESKPDCFIASYADIVTDMEYVYDDCASGEYFKADYFNKLADAINNFNLTISV